MRAQFSSSMLPSSSRKQNSASGLEAGDLTENTADISSRDDDEIHIEPHICSSQSNSCDTLRSLLSRRVVVKSKKGSNPRSQSTFKRDELIQQKSVRGGRRNSTTNLSGFLEYAEQQELDQPPEEGRRRPLVFRSASSVSCLKPSSGHDLKKLSEQQDKASRAPKRSDSVSLCGESTTTPKTAQSGMDRRAAFGASKQSDSVLSSRFLQYSATEWEDEYHKISALDSDDDDAVSALKKRSLETCRPTSPRRIVSRTRTGDSSPRRVVCRTQTNDISPRRIIGRVSSSVLVDDEMWTLYDQITSGDADEVNTKFESTEEVVKEKKKKNGKPSSKVSKKLYSAPKDLQK